MSCINLRYVEKLVETLDQKRSLIERYRQMTSLMIEKQSEMRVSMQKAHETLSGICKTSKILQKEVSFSSFNNSSVKYFWHLLLFKIISFCFE